MSMNFFILYPLSLGIVSTAILSIDKACCNALNEISYAFRYAIDEAPVLAQHWEERRGDIVHGSYSFLDPFGQIRTVEYQVNGDAGFRAVVGYRKPPTIGGAGEFSVGPLKHPGSYRQPVVLAQPVGRILDPGTSP